MYNCRDFKLRDCNRVESHSASVAKQYTSTCSYIAQSNQLSTGNRIVNGNGCLVCDPIIRYHFIKIFLFTRNHAPYIATQSCFSMKVFSDKLRETKLFLQRKTGSGRYTKFLASVVQWLKNSRIWPVTITVLKLCAIENKNSATAQSAPFSQIRSHIMLQMIDFSVEWCVSLTSRQNMQSWEEAGHKGKETCRGRPWYFL